MQVSEEKLNKHLEKQASRVFYQLIADLNNTKEAELFFKDFLTQTTILSLVKRLMIAIFLSKKRGYKDIKKNLKVSSSTIAEVYKNLDRPGIRLALKKVEAEEWASNWSKKISTTFKKIFPKR